MIDRTDALLALVRDHVEDRHEDRPWQGCPVCEAWIARNRMEVGPPGAPALAS